MNYPLAMSAALIVAVGVWGLWRIAGVMRLWYRFSGDRIVTCPETRRAVVVRIDGLHAVRTALLNGSAEVRLVACSQWSERGPCQRRCVAESQRDGRSQDLQDRRNV